MCKGVLFFFFLTAAFPLSAQNLVPNPGFEIFDKCPSDYTVKYRKELVPGWSLPTRGTPDYFNSCTRIQVGVPRNFMGTCLPFEGKAYAGLIVFMDPLHGRSSSPTNYREYLQTKLTEVLEKDHFYCVKFSYSLASYSTFAVNRLGVYLSGKKIGKRRSTRILPFKPQVSADSLHIITEHYRWFSVSDTIQAKGGEQYLTIGNFYDDSHTRYQPLDLSELNSSLQSRILQDQIAYYYIDMVSVSRLEKQ